MTDQTELFKSLDLSGLYLVQTQAGGRGVYGDDRATVMQVVTVISCW